MPTSIEKALQNLTKLLKIDVQSWNNGSEEQFWCSCLELVQQLPGGSEKIKKDISKKNNKEELQDVLAEIKYAIIFTELGFQVEVEPFGKKGPDLRIFRDGFISLVEVKRFRPSLSGLRTFEIGELSTLNELPEYGNPARDWQKIFGEIGRKFSQAGKDGIIAIWNSNDTLEPEEVESAAYAHLRQSSKKASFVLFKPDVSDRQFACFKLRHLLPPQHEEWMTEFKRVNPREVLFGPYLRNMSKGEW